MIMFSFTAQCTVAIWYGGVQSNVYASVDIKKVFSKNTSAVSMLGQNAQRRSSNHDAVAMTGCRSLLLKLEFTAKQQ